MNVVGVMLRLWALCQPGGSSESTSILHLLMEGNIPTTANDLLSGLRKWKRMRNRAIELNLTLPDPVILTGILRKYADALGKLGEMQLSYRIASARQELAVDVRPTAMAVEFYAEYLQSEAEELCLGIELKTTTGVAATLKALDGGTSLATVASGATTSASTTSKGACRYWKTTKDARGRGASCTFLHDTSDMKGKCFNCGSSGHVKRECPHKSAGSAETTSTSSSTTTPDGKKVSKVKAATTSSNGRESKGSTDEPQGEGCRKRWISANA